MKHKLVMAGILSMALVLTGCGQAAGTSSTEETTPVQTTAETEAETTAETEAETEEENAEATGEEPASADELAAVQAAIDGYLKASEEADYASLVKYYDVDLVYYMSEGKLATEEELIAELERMADDGEITVGESAAEGEFGAPVCCNSEAQMYNDFLASDIFSEIEREDGTTYTLDMAENFVIDGVYTFNYSAAGVEDGMSFDISMDMTVLRINGEWKVDNILSLMMAFSSMMEDMDLEGME